MSELDALTEVSLKRAVTDPSRYDLPGFGTLRVGGYFGGRGITIMVQGVTWQCGKAGRGKRFAAMDKAGQIDGTYQGPFFGIGSGTLRWKDRTLRMTKMGHPSRARYALQEHGETLCDLYAVIGNTVPVSVRLHRDDIDPALLMFAVFIARDMGRRTAGTGSSADGGGAGGDLDPNGGGGGEGGFSAGDGGNGCSGGGDGGGDGGCGGGGCGGGS